MGTALTQTGRTSLHTLYRADKKKWWTVGFAAIVTGYWVGYKLGYSDEYSCRGGQFEKVLNDSDFWERMHSRVQRKIPSYMTYG